MRNSLLPLAAALALAGTAAAEPVTVKVVSRADGSPVRGEISVQSNGAPVAGLFRTDAGGKLTLPSIICSPDVAVRVRPLNSDYSSDGQWRACGSNPIEYPMRPRVSAAPVRQFTGLPTFLLADQQALLAAMDADDTQVADLSREMAAKLRAAGFEREAKAYSALSIEAQAESLRAIGWDVPEDVVKWDPGQRAYVSTPETLLTLKAFQTDNRLAVTGQWDLRTANMIDQLALQQVGGGY